MKSQLIIPTFVAAATHFGILFGFNGEGDDPTVAPPEDELIRHSQPIQLFANPPPVETIVASSQSTEAAASSGATESFDDLVAFIHCMSPPLPDFGNQSMAEGVIQVIGVATPFVQSNWSPARSGLEGGVIGVQGLDSQAQATLQQPPTYPMQLRREGIDGQANVTFVVNESGRVITAKVESLTHREFGVAAEKAVRKWRFNPGTRNGRPVKFKMTVPVVFSIGND
jgi:protein TonB